MPEPRSVVLVIRALFIAALQATLSFADAEAPQPIYILRCVVAPTALSAPGERQRSEPLAEPKPARTYAEFACGLANRECTLLLKHTPNLDLTDNFV